MASRLTTNQEIAGSTPAVVTCILSFAASPVTTLRFVCGVAEGCRPRRNSVDAL